MMTSSHSFIPLLAVVHGVTVPSRSAMARTHGLMETKFYSPAACPAWPRVSHPAPHVSPQPCHTKGAARAAKVTWAQVTQCSMLQ